MLVDWFKMLELAVLTLVSIFSLVRLPAVSYSYDHRISKAPAMPLLAEAPKSWSTVKLQLPTALLLPLLSRLPIRSRRQRNRTKQTRFLQRPF